LQLEDLNTGGAALRDITFLVERRVLVRGTAGGRSTSYQLCQHPASA